MGLDQSSRFYGGEITIQLEESGPNHQSGSTIIGVVNVSLTEQLFPVKNLTVGLYGYEQTYMLKKGNRSRGETDRKYRGIFEIVKLEVPI